MTSHAAKRDIVLGEVQETLLIPLYFRARESERRDAICRDPRAQEIVEGLDYDFAKFDSWWLQLDIAIRTEVFDELVTDFLQRSERAVVVNLGAGLDGRFFRLDDGKVIWFDLDMPDSIALRESFYETSDRNHFVARSMFDYKWLDDVAALAKGREVLIVAEGLFCYFPEAALRELFARVAERFPGAEIVFQSISPEIVGQARKVDAVKKTRAEFKWGIHSGKEVAAWHDDYEFLGEWAYIDRHRRRWRFTRWTTLFLPWVYRRIRNVMKISHLRLGR